LNTGLKGKVVLITGASGGIGLATGKAFAAEGARLALHYHSNRATVEQLAAQLGPMVETELVNADLRSEKQSEILFERIRRRFGGVDILIANAGIWPDQDVPLGDLSLAQWRNTLEADLTSAFLSCREFFKLLQKQRRGNIVLIGSTAAAFGEEGHADYAAAKSAIAYGLTRTLKNEIVRLAPPSDDYCGGRVNCVCPGWTATPMTAGPLQDPAQVRRATSTMALPRLARAEDVAHAIVFLASDELAGHLTGQILMVAGGMEGRVLW
jgi:3-oxoacyl-[acyl-carrier protein] reductase